ncbi:hypothetical protein BHE74_00058576 [Ensete ventricosum]|nr:hypothetical protein GW17_00022539 [Ensete ventricosum]RWW36408.1 hypothetical protein BHE74_00058576 [Ensete ventricosum]
MVAKVKSVDHTNLRAKELCVKHLIKVLIHYNIYLRLRQHFLVVLGSRFFHILSTSTSISPAEVLCSERWRPLHKQPEEKKNSGARKKELMAVSE